MEKKELKMMTADDSLKDCVNIWQEQEESEIEFVPSGPQ